ncbi:hypothetical protein PVK06_035763 [Gossypium arboreum]|uniref:Uncharacterized protein n=1 Tax=Gossypium arboreum TaxID=29729 RepID=A0ABR0NHP0_GOSAR|nr:hypothetical protein PVK06_035763 [Gossypium arboreum]
MTVSIRAKVLKVPIKMSKGVEEQFDPIENRGRAKKASQSRDMLSALYRRGGKLEGFMGAVKETPKEVYEHKVTEKYKVLKDIVLALKEQIKELKGELNICKVALGNEVLAATSMPKVDILKPKKFNKMRFATAVGNFLWGME